MNVQLTIMKPAAWQAIVAAANASRPAGAPEITLAAYAQARLDELGDSYEAAAIEQAKRDNEELITLAAKLPAEKRAVLTSTVQQLAAEAGIL